MTEDFIGLSVSPTLFSSFYYSLTCLFLPQLPNQKSQNDTRSTIEVLCLHFINFIFLAKHAFSSQEIAREFLASTGNVIMDIATAIWFGELDKAPIIIIFFFFNCLPSFR